MLGAHLALARGVSRESLKMEFKKISQNYPFKILDQRGIKNCMFYEDAPGVCSPEFCPLAEGGDVINLAR